MVKFGAVKGIFQKIIPIWILIVWNYGIPLPVKLTAYPTERNTIVL